MLQLAKEYTGASCVIKTIKNDLLTMGVLQTIKGSYIDISNARNELPEMPYNMPVKIEIYNSQIGFKVILGKVYISSHKLARIIDICEATNDERREYFRINISGEGYIYINRDEDYEVELVDISLNGVLFKCLKEFQIGEMFSIRIPAVGQAEAFGFIIRRLTSFQQDYNGYGCEFTSLTSIQEDMLYKYMLKAQNDQLKKVR